MVERRASQEARRGRKRGASKSGVTKTLDAKRNVSRLQGRPLSGQPELKRHSQSLKATEDKPVRRRKEGNQAAKTTQSVGWSTRKLKSLRDHELSLRIAYHSWLGDALLSVYKVAVKLSSDHKEWMAFCNHADWDHFRGRPNETSRQNALRYAVRFMVGFAGQSANKRASKYLKRLKPFEGLAASPEKVRIHLFEARDAEQKKTSAADPSTQSKRSATPIPWDRELRRKLAKFADGEDILIKARVIAEGPDRRLKFVSVETDDWD